MINFSQKLLLFLVAISILFSPLSPVFQQREVRAVVGGSIVFDPEGFIQRTLAQVTRIWNATSSGITAAIKNHEWIKNTAEQIKKVAFAILKRAILDQLAQGIVRWIEGGGKGGIITDWDQFLRTAADRAGGEFAQSLDTRLCTGFSLNVQLALIPVEKINAAGCTLNEVIGNINNFMEDFRNGSWLGYQEIWIPRNNFYGATLIALDGQKEAESRAADAERENARAGSGFRSKEVCEYVPVKDGGTHYKDGGTFKPLTPEARGAGTTEYQYKCIVKTPGNLVADAANRALVGNPEAQLTSATADLVSAYLPMIVDAAINRLAKTSLEGLQGWVAEATRDTQIGPVLTNPCQGMTGTAFEACRNSVVAEREYFNAVKSGTRTINGVSLDARFRLAGVYAQSVSLQQNFVDALEELAVCQGFPEELEGELAEEQDTLDFLMAKFETNQSFLEPLIAQDEEFADLQPEVSVGEQDWFDLGAAQSNLSFEDTEELARERAEAEEELRDIQEKVNERLPGIESQLQFCPAPGEPAA